MDGVKYLNTAGSTDFAGTINAYSSPKEFDVCEGIADFSGLLVNDQPKRPFGLAYRTLIGNDLEAEAYGYKIHLIYNALVGSVSKEYQTIADSTEAITLSWPITAKPIFLPGVRPTAHLIIDSIEAGASAMSDLEDIIYGTGSSDPLLPTVAELATIFGFTDVTPEEPDLILDGGGAEGWPEFVDGGGP